MERLRSLKAQHVMAEHVLTVRESDSAKNVAQTLRKHEISGAPVADSRGHCVGIISLADLVFKDESLLQKPVGEWMTREVVTVTKDDSLIDVARIMRNSHRHRVPVVDRSRKLVGMITTMDIVSALVNVIDELDLSAS